MKRTFFSILLLLGLFQTASLAADDRQSKETREVQVMPFEKLSISANITVILYESTDVLTVVVKGKENYAKRIVVLQKDSRLIITTRSDANMREKVTVYVPVNKLKSLEVNDDALVKSQTVLLSPNLQVETNGLCEVHIIVKGEVQVKEGEHYTYVRRIRPEQVVMRLAAPVFY